MKKAITILGIMFFCCILNPVHAAIRVSAMSGDFYATSTWVGGFYPAFGDDIVISTGHTVTLNAAASVRNITIQPGATFVNGLFDLTILTTAVANPIYTNNGVHEGPGKLIAYEYYDTEITGAGVTNCSIEIVSYGLRVLSGCNLTINGNVQHSAVTSFSMNGKYIIDNSQGGTLTINGDIITTPLYYVGIQNAYGTLTINGDVFLYGGSEFQSGSTVENSAVLNISGNLLLGNNLGYAWNRNNGIINIGGDLLGSGAGETYFIQDMNATVRFGGSVFPAGNDGDLCVAGPNAEPNTVEYNGSASQLIKAPSDGAVLGLGYTLNTYSNLVINKTGGNGVALNSDIYINGDLKLTHGLMTIGTYHLTLGESATISGAPSAANMIVATSTGMLRKSFANPGSFTFPIGDQDGTTEYSPVTLEFTSGTFSSAAAGVNLVNASHPGVTGNFLSRCWTLSQAGMTNFSCNATFHYNINDVNGVEAELSCTKINPTPWVTYGLTDAVNHQLIATGISSFSTFTGQKSNVPTTINELANITIGDGVTSCYNATDLLKVAGNGTSFTVQSGGSATMIAGQTILYLPGTFVVSGGYMHGYITTTGDYCTNPNNPVVNAALQPDELKNTVLDENIKGGARIYPNPVTSNFTVEYTGSEPSGLTKIEIYTLSGLNVFSRECFGENKQSVPVSYLRPGMYVLHVTAGASLETRKLIKL